MVHEIVKNRIEDETIKVHYCNNDLASTDTIEGKHFGVPIHKKDYPGCYQYNVLIMLAKRLLKEDEEKTNLFANRLYLDKKLLKKMFTSEE